MGRLRRRHERRMVRVREERLDRHVEKRVLICRNALALPERHVVHEFEGIGERRLPGVSRLDRLLAQHIEARFRDERESPLQDDVAVLILAGGDAGARHDFRPVERLVAVRLVSELGLALEITHPQSIPNTYIHRSRAEHHGSPRTAPLPVAIPISVSGMPCLGSGRRYRFSY